MENDVETMGETVPVMDYDNCSGTGFVCLEGPETCPECAFDGKVTRCSGCVACFVDVHENADPCGNPVG